MINRVILIGRLTKSPEMRVTNNGTNVCSFTLAFDNKAKGPDGQRVSSFINCTAWRSLAEIITKYCEKGSQIGVEGSLQERKYQRRDGTNASTIEIVVDDIQLLGSKNSNSNNSAAFESNSGFQSDNQVEFEDNLASGEGDLADEDLPF